MEYHERQHQQPERTRPENNDRHGKTRRQRLFRPAELNCDAVRPVELQPRRQPVGQPQHQSHHQNCHHDQQHDLPPGNASPNPLHYGGRKRRVHNHHDRELIEPFRGGFLRKLAHPTARELPQHERQKQLNRNVEKDTARNFDVVAVH